MAIIEYVDRPGETRPARPAVAAAEEKAAHVPLAARAAAAVAAQARVAAAVKAGALPPTLAPAFPAPRPAMAAWTQFEAVKAAQAAYAAARREARAEGGGGGAQLK
jgi:hypothetical protein